MKYFSTFSGIGGFELGIQQAYALSKTKGKQQRRSTDDSPLHGKSLMEPQCIGYSEIDKYASAIYQSHFPEHKNYGDITKINAKDLPDFDIIVGGFPCQSFSIAGKRGGFDDTRGTLFFDVARIIREKQPRLVLLENVKGLLSHDGGATFRTIISTLDELGYDIQWQVLNSKDFGVPQNRERVFIVGHLRGTPRPEVFPFNGIDNENLETREISANGQSLSSGRYKSDIKRFTRGETYAVRVTEATKKGYAEATVGDSINLSVPNSATRRGRVGKGVAQTLDTGMQQYTMVPDLNSVVSYKDGKTSKLDDRALASAKKFREEGGSLFDMQGEKKNGNTPPQRELARQSKRKLGRDLPELSLSNTQSDQDLQTENLRPENAQTRVLREAQSEVREIRESADVQEESTQSAYRIRRLSPVECERLQGFPDGWTEGVSDTQRYKCLGNAITVNVIRAITGRLL